MSKAYEIASNAHEGQWYGNEPYLNHISRVRDKLHNFIQYNESDRQILDDLACLHDVLEDTDTSVTLIKELVTTWSSDVDRLIDALVAITKRDGESRTDYLIRCIENPLARTVKIADTLSNLECSIRSNEVRRILKYTKQLERIYLWDENTGGNAHE